MLGHRRPLLHATARSATTTVALCLFALSACGRGGRSEATPGPAASGAFPVRQQDQLGRTVAVSARPRRIVTLLPSHTETVCALGAADRLVGVDDYSDYPPEVARLPKLGGMYDARLESVLGLSPDLVLASETSPATASIERLGLTLWAGSPKKLDDVYGMILTTGRMLGVPERAKELADRARDRVVLEEKRTAGRPKVRVYYELDATPYAVGVDSFIGELLSKAGGENVVPGGIGEYPKVSPEVIAAADPEVVLGADYDVIAARPGWDRVRAVRDRRVHRLTPEERAVVVRPGPRVAEGLRVLARLLHPEVSP